MRTSLYIEDNDQLIEILKHLTTFQPFKEEDLKKLLRVSKIVTFKPTEIIIKEGRQEKKMFLLISGNVALSKENNKIMELKRTGDIFGEIISFGAKLRTFTVTAQAETSCLMFDAGYLETMEEIGKYSFHAIIYNMFAQILAQRLRVVNEKYVNLKLEVEKLNKVLSKIDSIQ